MVWGSPEIGNVIDIFGMNGDRTTYSGFNLAQQFGVAADGDNAETGLFTITAQGSSVIDHLVLRSSGAAFEVAVRGSGQANAVPKPATLGLAFPGLVALVMTRRRKSASH